MAQHWRYLKYLLKHKWFVLVEGRRLGVPLWRLVIHDWSKFLPSEWGPYAQNFGGNRQAIEDEETLAAFANFGAAELAPWGWYLSDRYHVAMNHHHKRNKHHWQYWARMERTDRVIAMPMPDVYRREMLADWIAVGLAHGRRDVVHWYHRNKDGIGLHSETKQWVENQLKIEAERDGVRPHLVHG